MKKERYFNSLWNPLIWIRIGWEVFKVLPISIIALIKSCFPERKEHKFMRILFSRYSDSDMEKFSYDDFGDLQIAKCYFCDEKANWVGFGGEILLCDEHCNMKSINNGLVR